MFTAATQNHRKNNLKEAEKYYEKILKIKSNHFKSIFLLGSLSLQIKNFDKARQLLLKATQINPLYVDAHNNLGVTYNEMREFQKAKGCYEKAIQIRPDFADAHNNLGIIFKELGEFQKAKNSHKKAIDLDSNKKEACYGYGQILLLLNQHNKALEYIRKGSGFIRFTKKNFRII